MATPSDSGLSSKDELPKVGMAGKRAMASMLKHSKADRIQSKKALDNLEDVGNAPSTTIHRRYWLVLFEHFASITLRIEERANTTPTGDDFARFLLQLPGHLQPRRESGQVSYTVVLNARLQLDRALTFKYADWELSKRDNLRIDACIQKLLDEERITKDPVREVQWITCQVVAKLVKAVFSDALANGTKSWDYTVARNFGLVLQAALASRAGDFRRSAHYTGNEYLKWKDIDMVATTVNGKLHLEMLVKLSYRKGFKREPGMAKHIELGQLSDENSAIDPTKLCVAYALRIGAVKERNWDDLVAAVLSRQSKRFVWTDPDSPVFYALTRGQRLDFSNPAPVDQQCRFLQRAAELVGMLKIPVSHDIRKGAAADIYALKSDTITGNTDQARKALGHSLGSMIRGTTDKYIGREKGDSWGKRVEQAVGDSFGVQFAPESFKPRKVATADIDRYCDAHDLGNTRSARDSARNALAKIQFDQWSARQKELMDADGSDKSAPPPSTSYNESLDGYQSTYMESTSATSTRDTLDVIDMHPALRVLTAQPIPHGQTDTETVEQLTQDCISMLASSQKSGEQILVAEPASFIGYFSSINSVSVATEMLPDNVESGNSRDSPSRFVFDCGTPDCERTFHSALRRDQHQVSCFGRPYDASVKGSATQGRKRKPADINKADESFPKSCDKSKICGVTKDFATPHLLKNHRVLHHDETWPGKTSCGVPGCQLPQDHTFVSREGYRRHLSAYHLMDTDEARKYIGKIVPVKYQAPRGASKAYTKTHCLFPGCTAKAKFGAYADYTSHLKKKHALGPEEYPKYMPSADTDRTDAT